MSTASSESSENTRSEITNSGPTGSQHARDWVEFARHLPIAFAQVREDPWIDEQVMRRSAANSRVLMIASGGCTAAWLAACGVERLHLVDINPAQLALARIKLWLLHAAEPVERMELLGHAPLAAPRRKARILEIYRELAMPNETLGPLDVVAEVGLDHCGRYEWLFAQLRTALQPVREELDAVLRLSDPREQARRVEPTTNLGRKLDAALDEVMALPILVWLFGTGATANRRQDFSRHFAERTRHVLATLPADVNPFLQQLYRGVFLTPQAAHAPVAYPWIGAPRIDSLPAVSWSVGPMSAALRAAEPGQYDVVHLSNILDWLAPDEARDVLADAANVVRPGGRLIIRQLNSQLDIRALPAAIEWEHEWSDRLHANDRSFFYAQLHVGTRPR